MKHGDEAHFEVFLALGLELVCALRTFAIIALASALPFAGRLDWLVVVTFEAAI